MRVRTERLPPLPTPDASPTCAGFCARCQTVHALSMGTAELAARALMQELDRHRRIDFDVLPEQADSRFATDYLFGEARGKMFGVLVGRQPDGKVVTLKAFSGQFNGEWVIAGWMPPVFELRQWQQVNTPMEKEIKHLGARIDCLGKTSTEGRSLVLLRKHLSRELMHQLHRLYTLCNFSSEYCPMAQAYTGPNGIPNGTGDCCGPKLLNFAAVNRIKPLGLAEFYYGRQNKQGDRIHGRFYPSCPDKCASILGFMLCGLDSAEE